MGELFQSLKEECLLIGISHFDFWELTYGEIVELLQANNKKEKKRLQEKAVFDYNLSQLIGQNVQAMLSKDAKLPKLHEIYPSLFDEPEEKENPQPDWQQAKQWLLKYSKAHNQKRKGVK